MPMERTERNKISKLNRLLSLLGLLASRHPSPQIRRQLEILAAQRLRANPEKRTVRPRTWLSPVLAVSPLLVLGLGALFIANFSRIHPKSSGPAARESQLSVSPQGKAQGVITGPPRTHPQKTPVAAWSGLRRMTMRLPYSNSAIVTGTDTTIRVSLSQSELVSMGFPINSTVQDRRIVAEVTLGDDGLPRAISLPLPIEVTKEKK